MGVGHKKNTQNANFFASKLDLSQKATNFATP
jgi:hypothetical protein